MQWMVFGQLVMPVQCCAGTPAARRRAPAQHCTSMTNWPNNMQFLGQDDLMSLGINLGAQNIAPDAWTYCSTHIRRSDSWFVFIHIRRSDSSKKKSPIFVNLIMVHLSKIHCETIGNLSWIYREPVPDASSWSIKFMKNMEFYLKWVHVARYELILKLDGALWLRIIFNPLLTQTWYTRIYK